MVPASCEVLEGAIHDGDGILFDLEVPGGGGLAAALASGIEDDDVAGLGRGDDAGEQPVDEGPGWLESGDAPLLA